MPAGRFVVPVVPFLALLAAFAIERLPWAPLRAGIVVVAVGSGLWATVDFARGNENTGRPHLELARTRAVLEEAWGPLPFVAAELANRAHLRDSSLTPAVQAALDGLVATVDRPIVLLSGQAGMVPFHVFQAHYGKVRFLDLYGLTDDALVRCLPERNLGRSIFGVGPSEGWLLAHPEVLERCGIAPPDVVYGVNTNAAKRDALRKAGYAIVYEQVGSLRSPYSFFSGAGNPHAYVAIREELVGRVQLPVSRVVFPLEFHPDRQAQSSRRR
ncbi:hypothetical protein [Vulgatibacter incomptus]|uniref:Uncharacterized protein n=1 Tax=Vulgatibacter incomptus TaxID=1391653 RepID=A0A0K1PF10_9BACT|nr:hypothetical protein [Vulgatibacter incomptus]AKU92105.1 hypothetical protein AKJ08_2492 [Vulgatibacter incomptus]